MSIHKYFLCGLLIIGLLALYSLWPALADDIVIDESGADAVGTAVTGEDGTPGAPGSPAAVVVGGSLTGQPGRNGDPGGPGGPGGDGVGGGSVQLDTTAPTDGGIVISTNGGAGGTGGVGGRGGYGGDGGDATSTDPGVPVIGGKGGKGGNGGLGGAGGTGGAGGSITLTIYVEVSGDLSLSATGGAGGQGGAGGPGGKGGMGGRSHSWSADSTAGSGGDGGDGALGGAPGSGGMGAGIILQGPEDESQQGPPAAPGASLPAEYRGADGEAGAGGSITVALNASVGGSLTADAGTGDISVTLNTGASVGGTIAANEAATSALRFAMTVSSKAEYDAAKAYLGNAANALSGSITIDGQTFTWTGFDQLIEALNFIRARSAASEATGPTYLACSPRAVTAVYKDGGIELIARRTTERGAFRIGRIIGQSFSSQNNSGWTVRFDSSGRGVRFDVLDRAGDIVATCRG